MIKNYNENNVTSLRNTIKEELKNDKLDVYFHFDIENEPDSNLTENTSSILCSILTNSIIEYDDIYLNNERELDFNEYKVHFALFQISDANDIRRIKDYISIDKWYKGTIYKNDKNADSYNINFIYSFSPIIIERRKLQFTGEEVDINIIKEVDKIYNPNIKTNKTISIKDFVSCVHNNDIKIKVYKLGDGNCNYILIGEKRLLYDIGYNIKSWPKQNINKCMYKSYICASREFKPDIVIISHWDLDHFIGCAYANDSLFKVPWIVKELKGDESINAKRLVAYLYKKDILFTYNCVNNDSNTIKICLGRGKDKFVSKRNCEGIYIVIEYDGRKALLTGDVPYKCITSLSDIVFMVAPHHGGKMEYINNFFNNTNRTNINKIAIFSTNGNNNNRPDDGHNEYLLRNGFETNKTESAKAKGYEYSFRQERIDEF